MTQQQIIIVKKSWSIFRGIDPLLIGEVFYSRLFQEEPALKKMFPANMQQQYQKIIDMLSLMVARLERMDELKTEMAALGSRHVGYGVKERHYAVVGNALLWTLQQGLGRDWNEATKEAWTLCYEMISQAMMSGTGSVPAT